MANNYPIVTLCGSTKFKAEFERVQKQLTLQGYIVISVGLFGHSDDDEVWEGMDEGAVTPTKMMLDDMHKTKIDMADEIFVVNPKGYIGDSTWSEICYARMTDKRIKSMECISEEYIEAHVENHIHKAEQLARKQLDCIRRSNGVYNIDDFAYFKHKGKIVVDPWINVETYNDGSPQVDHTEAGMGVDPFQYYGKKKAARFIEEIVMRDKAMQEEAASYTKP
jgi:hypothetical protein